MALPPHRIDDLFTSADVNPHEVAHILVSEGLYPETLEGAAARAAEEGKQAHRKAQAHYDLAPRLIGPTPAQAARLRFLEVMELEQELERVAKQYRDEAYVVITHPDADHLPAFAKGFGVELLATRGQEGVLVQVKKDRTDLQADPSVPEQARITGSHPGWRYDLVVLRPQDPVRRAAHMAGEPTKDQIEQMISEAETVLKFNSLRAAFVLAWAGLEAALRRYAQRAGLNGTIGTQPTVLLREVYGAGGISPEDFQRLESARQLRTAVVHGLAPADIEPATVQVIIAAARRLLADSEAVQPLAG